jgi:hypothetical protein
VDLYAGYPDLVDHFTGESGSLFHRWGQANLLADIGLSDIPPQELARTSASTTKSARYSVTGPGSIVFPENSGCPDAYMLNGFARR